MTRPMDRPAIRVSVKNPKPAVDARSTTRPDRDGTRGMDSTLGGSAR
jgi:hypothetical protein